MNVAWTSAGQRTRSCISREASVSGNSGCIDTSRLMRAIRTLISGNYRHDLRAKKVMPESTGPQQGQHRHGNQPNIKALGLFQLISVQPSTDSILSHPEPEGIILSDTSCV